MNVLNLAENIAEILGVPKPTAQVFARFGRDDAILTSRGRGRNVAEATPLDASFLTVAMMIAPRPTSVARYMADFGALRIVPLFSTVSKDMEFLQESFPEGHTFAEGLATLLRVLGSPEFVDRLWPTLRKSPGEVVVPRLEVDIHETDLKASLRCGGVYFSYEHNSLQYVDVDKLFGKSTKAEKQEQRAKLTVVNRVSEDARAIYNRPVKVSYTIEATEIIAIATALNGVSFNDLLAERSKLDSDGEPSHVIG